MKGIDAAIGTAITEGSLVLSVIALGDLTMELGAYDPGQLNQGLKAIGILALAVTAMTGLAGKMGGLDGLAAGGGILAISFGVKFLADAVLDLGAAAPEDVGQGLEALSVGLVLLLAAGAISTYFALGTGLAALGLGAAGLGVGAAGVGYGLKAFAEGLTILYDLLKEILEDFGGIVLKVVDFFLALGAAIGEFLDKWSNAETAFSEIYQQDAAQQAMTRLADSLDVPVHAISGSMLAITEALWDGSLSADEAITQLTGYLETLGLDPTTAAEEAKAFVEAIMLSIKESAEGGGEATASAGKTVMDGVERGIASGGASALEVAKGWMTKIAGALGVPIGGPVVMPTQGRAESAPTPTPNQVTTTAQPVVDATPVDMQPAIKSMETNATDMGTTYVEGILKQVPQSRASGVTIADNSIQGVISEAPKFMATGITSGTSYGTAIRSTSGLSKAAGTLVGVSSTTGAKSGLNPMTTTGRMTGANYVAGVTSRTGNSRSAGSGLSVSARSGASGISLRSVGVSLGSGLVSGVQSQVAAARAAGAALASAVDSGARARGIVRSPSRLTGITGAFMGSGFVKGVISTTSDAFNAGARVTSAAIDGVKSYANAFMEALNAQEAFEPVVRPVLDMTNINSINRMRYSLQTGVITDGSDLGELERMNRFYNNPSSSRLAGNISQNTQTGQNGINNDTTQVSSSTGDVFNVSVEVNNPTVATTADILDIRDTVLRGIDEGLGKISRNKAKGWAG